MTKPVGNPPESLPAQARRDAVDAATACFVPKAPPKGNPIQRWLKGLFTHELFTELPPEACARVEIDEAFEQRGLPLPTEAQRDAMRTTAKARGSKMPPR